MGKLDVIEKTTSVTLKKPWTQFALDKKAISWLEENVLYDYMRKCRWFAGKARMIKFLKVQQMLNILLSNQIFKFLHIS